MHSWVLQSYGVPPIPFYLPPSSSPPSPRCPAPHRDSRQLPARRLWMWSRLKRTSAPLLQCRLVLLTALLDQTQESALHLRAFSPCLHPKVRHRLRLRPRALPKSHKPATSTRTASQVNIFYRFKNEGITVQLTFIITQLREHLLLNYVTNVDTVVLQHWFSEYNKVMFMVKGWFLVHIALCITLQIIKLV